MDYFVTLEIEVLREAAASISAAIIKYEIANNIPSDGKDPINILGDKVEMLSRALISDPEYTMEDVKKIAAKLEFAREFIDEVIKANEA